MVMINPLSNLRHVYKAGLRLTSLDSYTDKIMLHIELNAVGPKKMWMPVPAAHR